MLISRRHKRGREIDPSDILLDSHNSPAFDTQQFEGVIERPISQITLLFLSFLCLCVGLVFAGRLFKLQVIKGEAFFEQSENNRLHHTPIFAERGVIMDRNGTPLASNFKVNQDEPFSRRSYNVDPGFAHVVGYVRYPQKDKNGFYWRDHLTGLTGVEEEVDNILAGENGLKIVETDALFAIQSENTINPPVHGQNIWLTLDARVQSSFYIAIQHMAQQFDYSGGSGALMNIQSGELIALTNYPEFDLNLFSQGDNPGAITKALTDENTPFLNRVVKGLYTPGSIVKPFIALAALNEGVITDKTIIYSTGSIKVVSPYDETQVATFGDWREEGHGPTDVYHAIADSVNTFFYSIGGGYKNQKGIGITNIYRYIDAFGIAHATGFDLGGEAQGVIPNPEWKQKVFEDDWRLGDTYITSIGQFGFQVTPLQMVRAVGALANNGVLVRPHVMGAVYSYAGTPLPIAIDQKYYDIVKEAMRQTVTVGTAGRLNVPYVSVAAKTGTAQVGSKRDRVNSWTIGFFPYEDPKYAFVIVMEDGPAEDTVSSTNAILEVLDFMSLNTPEYFEFQVDEGTTENYADSSIESTTENNDDASEI